MTEVYEMIQDIENATPETTGITNHEAVRRTKTELVAAALAETETVENVTNIDVNEIEKEKETVDRVAEIGIET